MKIDNISKEIFNVFKANGWTWFDGRPKSCKDVREHICSLLNEFIAMDDKWIWSSSGRTRVGYYKSKDEYYVKIDTECFLRKYLWFIDKDDLMVELI